MMTTTRALVTRVLRPLLKAVEGQPRGGPWHMPISGGWLTPDAPGYGRYVNWWQLGGSISRTGERSAVVARCISLYAKTTASLPGSHWRKTGRGGRERVTNSALSRILLRPNSYQSPSDFMLNLVDSLYRDGNAYALARRNARFEIDELHLCHARQSRPALIADDGGLFYQLGGNAIVDRMLDSRPIIVPQRDVLHIRLRTGGQWPQPLIGEPPLLAAMSDIAISDAFVDQQLNFLKNRAAPSAVLSTDLILDGPDAAVARSGERAGEGPPSGRRADFERRTQSNAVDPARRREGYAACGTDEAYR